MLDEDFSAAQAGVLDRYGVEVEERWIEVGSVDGSAHVLVAGAGPPVVLLNGIGLPAATLAPLMARIDGFTLYAVDLPGYGLTDGSADFASDLRANAVSFIAAVLDGLGLDRPAIVANSLGSLWASWFAIDHPDRVAALVHVGCPALVLGTSAPLPMRLLSVRPLGPLMMRLQPPSERQVDQLSKMVNEDPLPAEIASVILSTERLDHHSETFLAMLQHLLRLRGARPEVALTADQLAGIEAPTLLVFGRDDPMGGPDVGARVQAAMADAELQVVEGGHAPWFRHADQIAPAVNSFLDRVLPQAGA